MNFINDAVLRSILTSKHHENVSSKSIRILDWQIDDSIVKAGSNFSTQVSRLTIRYLENPQTEEHHDDIAPRKEHFFLKVPVNAPLYELHKQLGSYDKEVAIYTEVLPQMYIVVDEYFSPRQYYSDDEKSLVLEDLSQSGYRCADRLEQLDIEHCFHALRCLAKFHALSVKVESTVGLPESVKRDHFLHPEGWSADTGAAIKLQIPIFIDSLPSDLKDQYPKMIDYFQKLSSLEAVTSMQEQLMANEFKVLNHGDFWTNNIMFKYDKCDTIKEVKLIDFQMTTWSSPARDLIYFAITSIKFQVYRKYFPLLLKIYLDTLNRILGLLNCPTYNMSSLLDDIDIMFPFASITLCSMLPIIISDPDDPINTEEMSKDDKIEIHGMAKGYKQKPFRVISAKWFEHFAQKGTLRIDE
ncbi:uncharacterized protein LOC135846628 [Planococcus citri]|uniref:uncharacterized protein LOC135846628 n=1 Tax=Planococcus citri TaxID=170843 RepID=UPI0031F8CDE5